MIAEIVWPLCGLGLGGMVTGGVVALLDDSLSGSLAVDAA